MGILVGALAAILVIIVARAIRIVPHREAFIVERFGKYNKTLESGLHLLVPVIDKVAYKHILKEEVIDVPPQLCITKDNVQVEVDGVLYLMVMDAEKASYGIDNYRYATAQLAQTTMRAELGKIDLDRSFVERDNLNASIVSAVDEASDPWGIKVTRYEIKDITPSQSVLDSMEKQVRAEREKRAEILASEGDKEARINVSRGEKEEAINLSKAERQKKVNEAEGRAQAIELIASATANGIQVIADAINTPKGRTAVSFRIAEQFLSEFGNIISTANTSVLPADLANFKGFFQSVLKGDSGAEELGPSLLKKVTNLKKTNQ